MPDIPDQAELDRMTKYLEDRREREAARWAHPDVQAARKRAGLTEEDARELHRKRTMSRRALSASGTPIPEKRKAAAKIALAPRYSEELEADED